MPKGAQYLISWSREEKTYRFCAKNGDACSMPEEWVKWLEEHRSFAFHGRNGHINLLKERRSRGSDGYWYAYQRHGQDMEKRYIGRSNLLIMERLEEIAAEMVSTGSPGVSEQFEPLLMPKIQLPRPQKALLPRDRLLKLLDQGLEYKVTLIAGPAGYGKTTLVSQWLARHAELSRIACLTLDEGDNDPIHFWRYFIAACQQFQAGFGKEALELLYAHRLPPFKPLKLMLTALLNELSLFTQHSLLILEDFHLVRSPQVTETLGFLLDHLPTLFHLIILIRGDFPFSLARLRAHNELLTIYPLQLSFSLEETRAFFEQESLQLSPKLLRQLFERMDGWPAGLRLLVAELNWPENAQHIEETLAAFAGSNWSVQEYFQTQIVHTLPKEQQEFLLQTSMLSLLTAELCDTITGRTDSAQMIGNLHRGDHFLIPLNSSGIWTRYHTLFAEAMQQEARRKLGEEAVRLLSARASSWYEEHELLAEAIEAALCALTFVRASNLIEQFVGSRQHNNSLTTSEVYTLSLWLERIPKYELEEHPVLCLHYAMALLFIFIEGPPLQEARERIDALLQIAEQQWRDTNDIAHLAGVFAFRALLARREGKFLQAVTWARQSLAWLPQEERTWRNLSLTVVGVGELLDGCLPNAYTFLVEALAISELQRNLTYARATRGMIAWVHFERGELRQASVQLRQIQSEARIQEDYDDIAHTQLGLAQIVYQWNNLEEAKQAAQEAMRISEQMWSEEFEALATIRLALIEHAQQQSNRAQERLTSWLAQNQTPSTAHAYQLSREAQATLIRISLDNNNLVIAERWFADSKRSQEKLPHLQYQREQLLLARLLLAQKATSEAIELLESLYTAALETGHVFLQLEIQVLMILAYSRQGSSEKARQNLHALLRRAQSEGYMRLFLNEGAELTNWLKSHLPHEQRLLTYAHCILSASAQVSDPLKATVSSTVSFLLEPLSPQEQKVLRLLTAGNSNAEIARELVVSVNTVRTQLQSIYRKLNVNNRSEASKIAKQLEFSHHPIIHSAG